MQRRRTTIVPPLLWSTAAAGAVAALARMGRGDPRFDVPTDPTSWPQWWTSQDPLDSGAALGRWVALVLVSYLAVVSLLHLAAALAPRGRLRRVARAATPRFLTGLLAGAVVVAGSSTVGATTPDQSTTSALDGSNPPVMRVIEAAATQDTSPPPTTVAPPSPTTTTTTTSTIDMAAPTSATPLPYLTSPPSAPSVTADEPMATAAEHAVSVDEVVVAPGDHLWAIAERTIAERLGTTPTDAAIADYWRLLIETNRERLVDPHDPSLIHPGQLLVIPT